MFLEGSATMLEGLDTGLFVVCGTHFRTGRIWVKVCEIIFCGIIFYQMGNLLNKMEK